MKMTDIFKPLNESMHGSSVWDLSYDSDNIIEIFDESSDFHPNYLFSGLECESNLKF